MSMSDVCVHVVGVHIGGRVRVYVRDCPPDWPDSRGGLGEDGWACGGSKQLIMSIPTVPYVHFWSNTE
jgi:hypothetical protein